MANIKKVACALLVKNRSLLIQDRKGIAKYGEEWSFFGGGIEDGETPREALLREMREELNLDISSWDITEGPMIVHHLADYDIEYHRFLFLIYIPDAFDEFHDLEGSGAHFFSIDQLENLRFNTDISEEIIFLEKSVG